MKELDFDPEKLDFDDYDYVGARTMQHEIHDIMCAHFMGDYGGHITYEWHAIFLKLTIDVVNTFKKTIVDYAKE